MGERGAPLPVPEPSPAPGRSLWVAVATAVAFAALFVAAYALGPVALLVLVCALVSICLFELYGALLRAGGRPVTLVGHAGALGMTVSAYLGTLGLAGIAVVVTTLASLVWALRPARVRSPAGDVAWTVLGVAWIGGGGAAAAAMLSLDPSGGLLLVAFVVATALDDTGAYFAGTRFGRHMMAPSISPKKSWEGYAGGLVCALAGGLALGGLIEALSVLDGVAIGAICGIFGPAGDLVESLVKRDIGVKDSGRLLPGHGGLLDRLDAMIFCAPLVLLYVRAGAGLA